MCGLELKTSGCFEQIRTTKVSTTWLGLADEASHGPEGGRAAGEAGSWDEGQNAGQGRSRPGRSGHRSPPACEMTHAHLPPACRRRCQHRHLSYV